MVKTIGNVQKDAQVRAVASGTLSNGDTVIVSSDGTVSAVAGQDQVLGSLTTFKSSATSRHSATFDSSTGKVIVAYRYDTTGVGEVVVGTVSGTSISFGTPVVFTAGNTTSLSATFDSANNKVVIAFLDGNNSSRGTAVVGTVSGTSISFGTSVAFWTSTSDYISATFDTNSEKVVIAWRNSAVNSYGYAIVGTVSGTSISFGTAVVFESARSDYISATFDSVNNKVVISYMDDANSSYGTAIVGTVSGTSISFGTAVVFATSTIFSIASTFDTANEKVVIVYRDNDASTGEAIVGTVSGTSISFGTAAAFLTGNIANFPSVSFDSSTNKIIIPYRDNGTGYGTLVVGTVSGTDISYDTPVVFESASTFYTAATFDSVNNKTVVAYEDDADQDKGIGFVFSPAFTNLTADGFIGFADGAYADTQSAVINTTCSVDRSQTGLTAGQKYYVQTDGSLGTTAADPSVEAGTAISSTEILVKG